MTHTDLQSGGKNIVVTGKHLSLEVLYIHNVLSKIYHMIYYEGGGERLEMSTLNL